MTDTEKPGGTIPPCPICDHREHGMPCTVPDADGVQTVLAALGLQET